MGIFLAVCLLVGRLVSAQRSRDITAAWVSSTESWSAGFGPCGPLRAPLPRAQIQIQGIGPRRNRSGPPLPPRVHATATPPPLSRAGAGPSPGPSPQPITSPGFRPFLHSSFFGTLLSCKSRTRKTFPRSAAPARDAHGPRGARTPGHSGFAPSSALRTRPSLPGKSRSSSGGGGGSRVEFCLPDIFQKKEIRASNARARGLAALWRNVRVSRG